VAMNGRSTCPNGALRVTFATIGAGGMARVDASPGNKKVI
jgi:hypothetical protein